MDIYKIYVRGEAREATAPAHRTLLDAASAAGLPVMVGCKGGGCGVCKILIVDGQVEHGMYAKSALSDDERGAGYVLACQARPISDVTIDFSTEDGRRKPEVECIL